MVPYVAKWEENSGRSEGEKSRGGRRRMRVFVGVTLGGMVEGEVTRGSREGGRSRREGCR